MNKFTFSTFSNCLADHIQLNINSILNVPLDAYEEFYFIVNGEKFKTTRIISDLLSPKICQIHRVDPTVDSFIINTINKGDFSKILNIINFKQNQINERDFDFISEIIEIFGNESIQIKIQPSNITINNVFELLKKHLKSKIFFKDTINLEINFISNNLYEILDNQEENLMNIDMNTLERILNNRNLQIKNENQLLSFINHLYHIDPSYSPLFEYVLFQNVDQNKIIEFLNIFDFQYLTNETWSSISERLKQEIKMTTDQNSSVQNSRYKQNQSSQPKQQVHNII